MGWGDELIATGQAKAKQALDPRRVRIVGRDKQPRAHEAWAHNPRIVGMEHAGSFQYVINGPNARPYIEEKTPERWIWRDFQCTPGELYFSREEKQFAQNLAPQVVIEPNLKPRASPNKQWGPARWLRFIELAGARGIRLAQLGASGGVVFPGVEWIPTPSFRHGCAVLARAQAYVGHEGGLHHAAAAVGIPAVVIFGGFISPAQTGYEMHVNLFTGGKPCGMRIACPHCERAMAAIEPEHVITELETLLGRTDQASRRRVAAAA